VSKLQIIQSKLKVPKNQKNTFAGYSFRSCEDILEKLKPLLNEVGCHLIIKDTVELIGDRYYIKATVELYDDDKLIATNCAYAREGAEQRGLSPAQLSGSCSSYANKFALSSMFLCDDTRDDDALAAANNDHSYTWPSEKQRKDVEDKLNLIKQNNILNAKKFQGDMQTKMLNTINDPKFNNVEGQETLAARIKEQLLKQTENLPPPKAKPTGAKDAHFSLG
jgi:hypothetical protein